MIELRLTDDEARDVRFALRAIARSATPPRAHRYEQIAQCIDTRLRHTTASPGFASGAPSHQRTRATPQEGQR